MSTSYRRIKFPITDFEIKKNKNGVFINLCIGNHWTGSFWVENEYFADFLYNCLVDNDGFPPYHGYFGGKDKEATLIINKHLPNETKLISDYNEVFIVAELKAKYKTIEDRTNEN